MKTVLQVGIGLVTLVLLTAVGMFAASFNILDAAMKGQPPDVQVTLFWMVIAALVCLVSGISTGFFLARDSDNLLTWVKLPASIVILGAIVLLLGLTVGLLSSTREPFLPLITLSRDDTEPWRPLLYRLTLPFISALSIFLGGSLRVRQSQP